MRFSNEINELAAAMAAAQGDLPVVEKGADNPFFKSKYADLAAIAKAIQPVLKKHGLSVVQTLEPADDGVIVNTALIHKSGQWIEGGLKMKPVKNDPQGIGSCITYARRYSLSAILGLVTEEDDDGNAASSPQEKKHSTPDMSRKKSASPIDRARAIYVQFTDLGWKKEDILNHFAKVTGKRDMNDLTLDDIDKLDISYGMAAKAKAVQKETPAEVVLHKVEDVTMIGNAEDLLA